MKYQKQQQITVEMVDNLQNFTFTTFQVFFRVFKQQFLTTRKHLKIFSKFSVGRTEQQHLLPEPNIIFSREEFLGTSISIISCLKS